MTTKFLDNKIYTFKILLSWRFPRKNSILDDFSSLPPIPPLKTANFILIVVSPSLRFVGSGCAEIVQPNGNLHTLRPFQDTFMSALAWVSEVLTQETDTTKQHST